MKNIKKRVVSFFVFLMFTFSVTVNSFVNTYAFVGVDDAAIAALACIISSVISDYAFQASDNASSSASALANDYAKWFSIRHPNNFDKFKNLLLNASLSGILLGSDIKKLTFNLNSDLVKVIVEDLPVFLKEVGQYDAEKNTYKSCNTPGLVDSREAFDEASREAFYYVYGQDSPDIVGKTFFNYPLWKYFTVFVTHYEEIQKDGHSVTKYLLLFCTSKSQMFDISFLTPDDDGNYVVPSIFNISKYNLDLSYSRFSKFTPEQLSNITIYANYSTVGEGEGVELELKEKNIFNYLDDILDSIKSLARDVNYHYSDGSVVTNNEITATVPGIFDQTEDGTAVFVGNPSASFGLSVGDVLTTPANTDVVPDSSTVTNTVTGAVSITNVGAIAQSVAGSISATYGDGTVDLDNLKVPHNFTTVFPFSIPFDIKRCIDLLYVKSEVAPVVNFDFSEYYPFNMVPAQYQSNLIFQLDFGEYTAIISVVKFFTILGYSFFLIIVTRNLIRG